MTKNSALSQNWVKCTPMAQAVRTLHAGPAVSWHTEDVSWPSPCRVGHVLGRLAAVSWRMGSVSQGACCALCRAQGRAVLQRLPGCVAGPLGRVVALCRRMPSRCCASYRRLLRPCRTHNRSYRGLAWSCRKTLLRAQAYCVTIQPIVS